MFSKTTTALLALPLLATAHFQVTWPPSRGFIDDNEPTFPCGGFNDVNATRTMWPMNGAPIQMDMHHTQSNVQILLALGNDPGSAFNYVLRPTVSEQGPNNFCAGMVIANMTGMNITEGMNATIQVVTNGDPNGGLYQCSDITFTSTPLSTSDYNSHCQNSTGVTASFTNLGNANQSTGNTASTMSMSASGSATAAASSTKTGGVPQMTAGWVMGAVGVVGALAVL